MTITVKEVTSLSKSKETELRGVNNNRANNGSNQSGIVSESFFLGDITTMPLIYLEGEMQQREFYKPGLSMGAINILEEDDPALIKEYLCGFIDLPTNLLNLDTARNNDKSICIGPEDPSSPKDDNIAEKNPSWSVKEVIVNQPSMVYSRKSEEIVTLPKKEEPEVFEVTTTTASEVVESSYSSLDGLIEEFSIELEKKLTENGHSDDDLFVEAGDLETVLKLFREEQEGGIGGVPGHGQGVGVVPDIDIEYITEDQPEVVGPQVIGSGDNYVVEDVLLIYNNGTLIVHARRETDVEIDDDIFSGMLTAVKAFIKDSFRSKSDGGLKRMDFGVNKLLIEQGQNVFLTSILHGGEPLHLPMFMMEVLKDVEEKYGSIFKAWDGNLSQLGGINEIIEKLLSVRDELTVDIKGFESGAVGSTLKLLERANRAGIQASSPEIFAQNVTEVIEKDGFGNAWDYVKRTENELIEHLDENGGIKAKEGDVEFQVLDEPDVADSEDETDTAEMEDVINGIIGMMDELDSEKRGTDEERAKLRDMVNEIEEKIVDLGFGTNITEEDKSELKGAIEVVEEKMNELKMEKMDAEVEKAEMEGAIKGIEDKMEDLEISQIGVDAESTELKRMMDGIEDKIQEMEGGNIESEVAKAEFEGMIKGIEDKMEELEISQIGTDAERTELKRMTDVLSEKISDLDNEKMQTEEVKTKTEDMMKEMESKMTALEDKIQGTQERMEELEGEIEVKRFTVDYIQGLEDRAELESLCKEVGLSCDGTDMELKNRLLLHVEGIERDAEGDSLEKDPRFTRENIECIGTKAELVALCEEAGLKKSGRKEELRSRLLKYVEEKESEAKAKKLKEERFTRENIESIETKGELSALCEEAGLKKSGTKEELRERLLKYAEEQRQVKKADSIDARHPFKIEGADKLTAAVLGDMYKHIVLELGDDVQEYINELEGFIRSVLEVREEMGLKSDEFLKSVVVKPNNEKTADVLNKLKKHFLTNVKAEDLEVVEPKKQWSGIKLVMQLNKDIIATSFTTQATKIQTLLKFQDPQKIKEILEEKGEYTLGIEGYPVTITAEMLEFKRIYPDNVEIRELESGIVYINKEVIKNVESEEELPSPTESEDEIKVCPDCNGEASYIEKYDRYYCYTCSEYINPVVRDELETPMDAEVPEEAIEPEDPLDDESPFEKPPSPLDDQPEPEPQENKRGFFGRFKRKFKK